MVFETTIRTRYAETDQMGYVYYGHYLTYLEVARTEAIRELGFAYKILEEEYGVMLPVGEAALVYRHPARYDDLLTLRTTLVYEAGVKIRFDTDIFNAENRLLVSGSVTLVFVNRDSRRPCRPPQALTDAFERYRNRTEPT
jgi:acyl-CoA thioester hydrolase